MLSNAWRHEEPSIIPILELLINCRADLSVFADSGMDVVTVAKRNGWDAISTLLKQGMTYALDAFIDI